MKFKDYNDSLLGFIVGILTTLITVFIVTTVTNDDKSKEEIWQHLSKQISVIKTDVDILKGKMKMHENLPIILLSRIEILETRYDNLVFFQREIKDEKPKEKGDD